MAKTKVASSSKSSRKVRPALSPEARENQLISLATDLVEQRLIDGTASSQETVHFLKLATRKSRLENEILEKQKELMDVKKDVMQSTKRLEEVYEKALSAMRNYSGQGDPDDY